MIALGAQSFIYDTAQQPISLFGSNSGTYTYDGNLKRVKAVVDGETIYNIYDASGTLVHVDNRDSGGSLNVCLTSCGSVVIPKTTDYIKAGGMTIARISNGTPTYLHPDHLGSPQTGTDENGTVVWREQYTPYGEKITAHEDNNDLGGYTGHISDSATGLTYMQARYYDPAIGRFLSIDPVGFVNTSPVSFNRYAYANTNPYKYIDPDGEFGVIGALVGIGFEVIAQAATGELSLSKESIGKIAVAGAVGAFTGGVGGSLANTAIKGGTTAARAIGTSAIAGGTASAAGTVASNAIDGKATTPAEAAVSFAAGAAGAGAGAKSANNMVSRLEGMERRGNLGQEVAQNVRESFGGGAAEIGTSLGEVATSKAAEIAVDYILTEESNHSDL